MLATIKQVVKCAFTHIYMPMKSPSVINDYFCHSQSPLLTSLQNLKHWFPISIFSSPFPYFHLSKWSSSRATNPYLQLSLGHIQHFVPKVFQIQQVFSLSPPTCFSSSPWSSDISICQSLKVKIFITFDLFSLSFLTYNQHTINNQELQILHVTRFFILVVESKSPPLNYELIHNEEPI